MLSVEVEERERERRGSRVSPRLSRLSLSFLSLSPSSSFSLLLLLPSPLSLFLLLRLSHLVDFLLRRVRGEDGVEGKLSSRKRERAFSVLWAGEEERGDALLFLLDRKCMFSVGLPLLSPHLVESGAISAVYDNALLLSRNVEQKMKGIRKQKMWETVESADDARSETEKKRPHLAAPVVVHDVDAAAVIEAAGGGRAAWLEAEEDAAARGRRWRMRLGRRERHGCLRRRALGREKAGGVFFPFL